MPPNGADVDARARLMLLIQALRNPSKPAPVNGELERRLDAVDQRLQRLAEGYRHADAAWRR